MAPQANKTTDHDMIKQWATERDGKPSVVNDDGEQTQILRINFPGYAEENLEEISWDEWFDIFEERELQFLYQEETSEGDKSNFNKLISRNS